MNFLPWIDDLLEIAPIIEKLLRDGFTLGVLLSVAVFLIRRYKKRHSPNQLDRIEKKVDIIAVERGITWDAHGLTACSTDSATKSRFPFISRLGGFITALIAALNTKLRIGGIRMRNYLKKLGSRKFQAFLAVTIPNLIIMFGFIFGGIDLEGEVNQWMPAINLVVQAITTAIYQREEAKTDVANIQGGNHAQPNLDDSEYIGGDSSH